MLQQEFSGRYFSGRSALREEVQVRVTSAELVLVEESGVARSWPWPEVRLARMPGARDPVKFEHGADPVEILVIEDGSVLDVIREVTGLGRFAPPRDPRRGLLIAIGSTLTVILLVALFYLRGLPACAALVAERIPLQWEEALGAEITERVAPTERRISDPTLQAVVDSLVGRLSVAAPAHPYHFRVVLVREDAVNALAAPGGYVIVYSGLLKKTEQAEQLAGVLAHELEHVLEHHSVAGLLRDSSIALLLRIFAGDSGALATLVQAGEQLGALAYSRRDEQQADEEGFALLVQAGIDPRGMVEFFRRLESEENGKAAEALQYLSSHPSTVDRIAKLERLTDALGRRFEPITTPSAWPELVVRAIEGREPIGEPNR